MSFTRHKLREMLDNAESLMEEARVRSAQYRSKQAEHNVVAQRAAAAASELERMSASGDVVDARNENAAHQVRLARAKADLDEAKIRFERAQSDTQQFGNVCRALLRLTPEGHEIRIEHGTDFGRVQHA